MSKTWKTENRGTDGDVNNVCFFLARISPNRELYFSLMQSDILESVQENYICSCGHICLKTLQGFLGCI